MLLSQLSSLHKAPVPQLPRSRRSGNRLASFGRMGLVGLVLTWACPLFAAEPASPAKVVQVVQVDGCADPVDVQIRVVEGPATDVATCGAAGDFKNSMPDATTLAIGGKDGVLDVHLVLRTGGHEVAYEALGVQPDADEILVHPTGGSGPDVGIRSARAHGEFVRLEVINSPAAEIAAKIAVAKNLQIDHVERLGKTRVTLRFARVPVRAVVELLDDVAETDTQQIGDRHFDVHASHLTQAQRKLFGAANSSEPKVRDAALEKIVASAGNATKPEEVESFQFHALDSLGEYAIARKDYANAEKYYARSLAVRDVRDQGRHDVGYARTLAGIAKARVGAGRNAEAIETLDQAQKIVIAADGEQSEELAPVLAQLADVYLATGKDDLYEATLQRAIDRAKGVRRIPMLTTMAMRRASQGRLEEADTLLSRAYAYYSELSPGIDDEAIKSFNRANENMQKRYRDLKRYNAAERYYRRAIELSARAWGKDDPLTADEVYFLAMNLVAQDKFDAAETELARYVEMDRKNPKPGLFRVASTEYVALLRLQAHDYAAAARYWEEVIALRLKLFGAGDPAVVLGLRELAIIDIGANLDAAAQTAAKRADANERAKHPQPADSRFAEEAAFARKQLPLDLMPRLATSASSDLTPPRSTQLTDAQKARSDRLATAIEAYAETREHIAKYPFFSISAYEVSVALRERTSGLRDANTISAAKRLLSLYQREKQADKADLLRTRYALD